MIYINIVCFMYANTHTFEKYKYLNFRYLQKKD